MALWLSVDCSDETFANIGRQPGVLKIVAEGDHRFVVTDNVLPRADTSHVWVDARRFVERLRTGLPDPSRPLTLRNIRLDDGSWFPISATINAGLPALEASGRVHLMPVVLTAVVELGERVPDGRLIELLEPAWTAIIDYLDREPEARFKIPDRRLEELVAASYRAGGFDEVVLTPRSGDGGRDVIAVRKGLVSIRILDQVKAYSTGHKVTADDVRALLGVLASDRNASKGLVTTTAVFAPMIESDPSIAPFLPHRLQLVDGVALLKRLHAIRTGNPSLL